jgi:hypothetical protein
LLGGGPLPEHESDAQLLLQETAELLFDHSLLNGHPRFWGYITSSAAPIGALGELLATAVNPNVGAWALSPIASAIEEQTVRWIAKLMGYPSDGGGLVVSGGNMANFVGFLAARRRTRRGTYEHPASLAEAVERSASTPHLKPARGFKRRLICLVSVRTLFAGCLSIANNVSTRRRSVQRSRTILRMMTIPFWWSGRPAPSAQERSLPRRSLPPLRANIPSGSMSMGPMADWRRSYLT